MPSIFPNVTLPRNPSFSNSCWRPISSKNWSAQAFPNRAPQWPSSRSAQLRISTICNRTNRPRLGVGEALSRAARSAGRAAEPSLSASPECSMASLTQRQDVSQSSSARPPATQACGAGGDEGGGVGLRLREGRDAEPHRRRHDAGQDRLVDQIDQQAMAPGETEPARWRGRRAPARGRDDPLHHRRQPGEAEAEQRRARPGQERIPVYGVGQRDAKAEPQQGRRVEQRRLDEERQRDRDDAGQRG